MENKISKQSIRTGVSIYSAGEKLDKDTIIFKSEKWSDKEITFFRKMLKQGGRFSIKGEKFYITVPEQIYNNKGEVEGMIHNHEDEENS
jgi:hypothetical protein